MSPSNDKINLAIEPKVIANQTIEDEACPDSCTLLDCPSTIHGKK